MAIDIQSPNLSGLTALASRQEPLNIQPTGALGLQALQQIMQQEQYLRSNALAQQQLQQQGAIATRGQNIQQQMGNADLQQKGQLALGSQALQQQAIDQQASQQQQQGLFQNNELDLKKQALAQSATSTASDQDFRNRQLAQQNTLGQEGVDVDKSKVLLDEHKLELERLTKLNAQDLQKRGAFAAYSVLAMKNAQTPDQAQQIRNSILQEAVSKGFYTKEQADQASKLPISQFNAGAQAELINTGTADDFAKLAAANKTTNTSGTHLTIGADGTVNYSQDAAKPVQAQAQKDIMGANDNLTELHNLYKNVPDSFFGSAALGQTASYLGELGQNIPVIGKYLDPGKEAKTSLQQYSNLQSASEMMSMNVIKQLSGVQYSDKQLEFMKKILPEFGPTSVKSVFDGRVQNLERFFEQTKLARAQVLKDGLVTYSSDPNSDYAKAVLNKMQENMAAPSNTSSDLFTQYRNDPAYAGWSDDKIRRAMQNIK